MVFFVKSDDDDVRVFLSESEMKAAGFKKADLTVTEEEFNSNGCYVRLIDGEIVVGKTEEEIAESERQARIAEQMERLQQIDRESGASRQVRDVSISSGVVLDAVRVLIARFAKDLNIKLPKGFGAGVASAQDILNLKPSPNATEKEKEDFAVFKALLLVSHFDPSINQGLARIRQGEMEAAPVRLKLAELT